MIGFEAEWNHDGELSVGWGGTGSMTITNSSIVQNGTGIIGDGGGTGTVTVSNLSRWTNTSDLYIGKGGDGTLSINSGSQVQNAIARIAAVAGE